MEMIKNAEGKTVCAIDVPHKTVEIVRKGRVTTISFQDGDKATIKNS